MNSCVLRIVSLKNSILYVNCNYILFLKKYFQKYSKCLLFFAQPGLFELIPIDTARKTTSDNVVLDWAKNYTNDIADSCLRTAIKLGKTDLINRKYTCSSFPFYASTCFFQQTDSLYNAYESCQKQRKFRRNKRK